LRVTVGAGDVLGSHDLCFRYGESSA
jgi:hypothetical protein